MSETPEMIDETLMNAAVAAMSAGLIAAANEIRARTRAAQADEERADQRDALEHLQVRLYDAGRRSRAGAVPLAEALANLVDAVEALQSSPPPPGHGPEEADANTRSPDAPGDVPSSLADINEP